jgi:hypothetical protein
MKRGVLRLFPPLLAVSLWSGCASSGPPLPPSLELPAPVRDLRAVRKGDRVSLTWTVPTEATDHESLRHAGPARICRSTKPAMSACGTPIGTVPPPKVAEKAKRGKNAAGQKINAAYTDNLVAAPGIQPADEVTYAVEVLNQYGRSAGLSNQVHVPVFPALPPPDGFRAVVTSEGVKVSWICPDNLAQLPNVQYRLRVYRTAEGSANAGNAGEADLLNCPGTPLVDTTFEWEKTYDYRAAAVIVVTEPGKPPFEIEGDDTPRVRVFAHDVFPPAVPSGLQAVFSGVGQPPFIDLVWSPDTDADLAGYNVYRHEEGGQPARLNSELIRTPAYRDSNVQSGKKYFYSVSGVDLRGNESAMSEEASERVP